MNSPEIKKRKVIVVGIDGGDFELTKKWVAEGQLPNFAKFFKGGASGPLKSTTPPMTAPAWPSFMTGKNPGKHGIFDFFTFKKEQGFELNNFSNLKAKTIFEAISEIGYRVGVMNVPTTYPPIKLNGFMISGYPCPYDNEKICEPKSLLSGLSQKLGQYRMNLKVPNEPGKEMASFNDIVDIFEVQRKYLDNFLSEKFDFFMVVFSVTDFVSHFFYKFYEGGDPVCKDFILKIYQKVDEELGKIIESHDLTKTTIILMSDHGFGRLKDTVNLNIYFLKEGMITLKNNPPTRVKFFLFEHGLTPENIFGILKRIGLKKIAWLLPRKTRDGALGKFLSYEDVDWEKSAAISIGHIGQVFLLDKSKKDEVIAVLRRLKDPRDNEEIVTEVVEKESVCAGPYFDRSPDLHVVFKDRSYVSYPLFAASADLIAPNLAGYNGHHRDLGIFFALGADIKAGVAVKASIIDLAPTILSLFGIPLDPDFDGRVLEEILFKNDETKEEAGGLQFKRQEKPLENEEKRLMQEKLKDLGYLG